MNTVIAANTSVIVPIMSPVPRRDSAEVRGRSGSVHTPSIAGANGGMELHGIDRLIESLKMEVADLRKSLRELDDRCKTSFIGTL